MKKRVPRVGSLVTWKSQAQGSWKGKTGQVVEVVPAGKLPDIEIAPDLYRGLGIGLSRKHESYVVRVRTGKTEKSGFRHYWPRVTALTVVTPGHLCD